jgi:peroxiredoxin
VVRKIPFIILSLILAQNFLFAAAPRQTKTAELANNFTLLDLEDNAVSLSDFRGRRVILFFWTTWCPHCRRELRQLNDMQTEFLRSGTQLLAINIEESAGKVRRFMQNQPCYYKILLDSDAMIAQDYGIVGVPTYVFIDREGHVTSFSHYFSQNKYKEMISR